MKWRRYTFTRKFQFSGKHQWNANGQRETVEADKYNYSSKRLTSSATYNAHSDTLKNIVTGSCNQRDNMSTEKPSL